MTTTQQITAPATKKKRIKRPPFKMAILQVMQEHGLDQPIANAQILEAFVAKGWYENTLSTQSYLSQVLAKSAEIDKQTRGTFKANDLGKALLAHQDVKKPPKKKAVSPLITSALKELDIKPNSPVEANPFANV